MRKRRQLQRNRQQQAHASMFIAVEGVLSKESSEVQAVVRPGGMAAPSSAALMLVSAAQHQDAQPVCHAHHHHHASSARHGPLVKSHS